MAKNLDLDLSYLDDDDVPMQDAEPKRSVVEEAKGLEKVNGGVEMATGSELAGGQIVGSEQGTGPKVARSTCDVDQGVAGSGDL